MRSNQEEIIVDRISRELSIGNNEKDLAYEIFLKKISSSLQYDETMKIPRIGLFQKKKGLFDGTNLIDNSFANDTIIYSPFQNDKLNSNFAFFNIGIFNKPINNVDFDDNIFSLSINKPVLKLSLSSINQLDPNTSLLILKKNIEDKVNQLIMKSDFFEGINLWNDFIPSNESFEDDIKLDDTKIITSEINKEDGNDILGLDSFLPISEETEFKDSDINSIFDVTPVVKEEISAEDDINQNDLVDQIFSKNFKTNLTENDFTKEISHNDLDFDFNEEFNKSSLVLDDAPEIDDNNENIIEANEDKVNGIDAIDSITEISQSINNNELDWNKELEDELFSKNMQQDDEINIDFNSNNSNQDLNFEINSEKVEDIDLDFINEQIVDNNLKGIDNFDNSISEDEDNNSVENSIELTESFNDTKTENSADDNLVLENKNLESNIDDLFESIEQKDLNKPESPKEKKPFFLSNKLLIILLSVFVTLAAAGGVYYFFFSHKTTEVKHEEKVSKPKVENKVLREKVKEPIKTDSIKTDSVKAGKEEISKVEAKQENNLQKKEESLKNETSKVEKSISNQSKQPLPVEQKKEVKFSTDDLFKKMSGDRLISEKIYYDGSKYNIQTSSWQSKSRAEAEVLKFRRKGFNAYVVEADLKTMGIWYRVKIFDFNTKADAEGFIKKNNL